MENNTLKFDDPNDCHNEEEDKSVDEDIENDITTEENKMDLQVGMDFATAAELFEYYGNYGNEKGFPVMKRSSKKGDDGIVRWVMYTCARHSIVVLIQQRVKIVPEKYILRRWRKDIKRGHTKVKITYFDWMQNPENEQFDRLCNAFYQVTNLATGNKDKVEHVMRWIKKLRDDLNKCEGTRESSPPSLVPVSQLNTSPSIVYISPIVEEVNNVRSPVAAPKRGRTPFKRKQSTCEQMVQKKKEKEKVSAKEKKKKTKATNGNLEKTQKFGSTGSTQGCSSTLEELNDGYIGVELGMTQESITTKVPYGGSKAMEFDRYNVPHHGNVSFGNQSMTQIPFQMSFMGHSPLTFRILVMEHMFRVMENSLMKMNIIEIMVLIHLFKHRVTITRFGMDMICHLVEFEGFKYNSCGEFGDFIGLATIGVIIGS
ncbi:hypothetical protein FRX31_008730 [Thalictrum thalictroides]|uniref:Protein FAR1-RELATED SEQUENCE n=1 Tax=Thalictrum thalictroides TaxID=46969 RepID=A0A7J6WW94_THATH|nr:hypothetical protein FRX31_008730 [Thalictrum thalictroides]